MFSKYFLIITSYLILATILGAVNTFNGNFSGKSILFFPLGFFVWGDALILGFFLLISSIFLYFKNSPIYVSLLFSVYFSIRWFIEALYALNGQFSAISRPWEDVFFKLPILNNFNKFEVFVIYQLFATSAFVVSFLVFLYFLKKYLKEK